MAIPIIIAVEGNIGAGKTTLLNQLERDGHVVYREAIDEWGHLLKLFYDDPRRWCFTLQTAILMSMYNQHKQMVAGGGECVFVERSPDSAMLFARRAASDGHLSRDEMGLYRLMHEKLAWCADVTILLDTRAEECMCRVRARGRAAEQGVDLKYLTRLEQLHEQTFGFAIRLPGGLSPRESATRVCDIVASPVVARTPR